MHWVEMECIIILKLFGVSLLAAPPVIEPFSFPKNLQDGGRAQVTCAVSSGDMPIAFAWKKDGHQISPSLQVINI